MDFREYSINRNQYQREGERFDVTAPIDIGHTTCSLARELAKKEELHTADFRFRARTCESSGHDLVVVEFSVYVKTPGSLAPVSAIQKKIKEAQEHFEERVIFALRLKNTIKALRANNEL